MTDLDARLDQALAAVHTGSANATTLVALYEEAATQADDELHRGFFLTHAYVHALESGCERADALKAMLRAMGRET